MFSPAQIKNVVDKIKMHYSLMIFTSLGSDSLSDDDKMFLMGMGVDVDELENEFPPYMQMFMLGRLTAILKEQDAKKLSLKDFEKYLDKGQFIPLSERERAEYSISQQKTYGHLKGLANKIEGSARDIMLEENRKQLISKEISEGIKNRKSVAEIVSQLGHKTGEWSRDWRRIVVTEMQNIYNQGRAVQFYNRYGDDTLVWKQVFPMACRHCIEFYLTNGIGSEPRVFKLSQLVENGSNVGRKVADWKPVVESTHPHCFTEGRTPVYTSKGWVKIKDIKVGDLVLTHKGRFRKVTQLQHSERESSEIGSKFNFKVKNEKGVTISLNNITQDHPVMCNGGWVASNRIKIGDKLSLLYDKCENLDCGEVTPVFKISSDEKYPVRFCTRKCCNRVTATNQWKRVEVREKISKGVSLGNTIRFSKMSKEELRKLTKNARKANQVILDSGKHPLHSIESKSKANITNGKKKTFIELKLQYFLDQLGIDYVLDFYVVRKEKKKDGQNRLYFPDIYIPSLNIVIEADGENWHDEKYDKKRDRDIKELIGADTFRFKEDEIRNNGDKVYEELKKIVKNHRGEYSFQDVEVISVDEHKYIKNEGYKVKLYNFSVEEDESYIVNGIVVHNCRCDLRQVFRGQVFNKDTQQWEYGKGRERKVISTSKIKVHVGDKIFEI